MNPALAAIMARQRGGVHTQVAFEDDRLIINRVQDCTPIAEYAKARHNEGLHGSSEMKHAACIPNVIIEQYCNDNNVSFHEFMADPAHIRRLCNDPKNDAFRIWKGRL